MRVMIVGGTGTIGSALARVMSERHDVIRVGASSGDLQVDLADKSSIESLYDAAGPLDAVVSAAGAARFGPLEDLKDEDFEFSIRSQLMGNVNLVRLGVGRVRRDGSFTLTTGDLSRDPQPESAIASMVGAGLESFARAVALELEGRYRVNVVSPGGVRETMEALGLDPSPGIPAAELAAHYVRAIEGSMTGRILEPRSS
jgi:NAD(P)-dependent dehydrogenase (short-subunit alcohol dehydrogenase family)